MSYVPDEKLELVGHIIKERTTLREERIKLLRQLEDLRRKNRHLWTKLHDKQSNNVVLATYQDV